MTVFILYDKATTPLYTLSLLAALPTSTGYERGVLGYPTSDERAAADGVGRFNNFQYGAIDWTPQTGAHEVHGAIYAEWGMTGYKTEEQAYRVTSRANIVIRDRREN